MATLKGKLRDLQKLDTNAAIDQALKETVDDKEFFEDQVRKQLTAGFDKKGSRLRPYKSKKYAERKHSMNPVPGFGNPDLKLTGKFHRGLFARSSRDVIEITSADSKAGQLIKKYPGALGLGGQYKQAFIKDHLRPSLFSILRKKTGL